MRRAWQRIRPLLWDPPRWRAAVRRNLLLKVLSVLAAFCLWLFVNGGAREMELSLQVPLELRNIPASMMLISPRVDFVDVVVAGPRTILGRIDRGRLLIPLDLSGMRPGPAVFRIGAESINLPRGVKIARINPSQVTLELARIGRKTVPVRLDLEAGPSDDLTIASSKLAPQLVEVVGPASDLSSIDHVSTEPVTVSATEPGPVQLEVGLQSPGDYFSLSAERAAVEIRLEDQMTTREFQQKVEVRDAAARYTLSPKEVRLTLRGPKRILEHLELDAGAVYIDASKEGPGTHLVTPSVELPRGVEVTAQAPERLRLQIRKERSR